jgi:LytS/YehU family sensor histidine kinase
MRGELFRNYMVALIVIISSQLIYITQKQQKTSLENESLRAEYMRSRYEALKNQVDPHFLFNSLNTLNSLIKVDANKAQEYVQQLSYVFRYTLQNAEVISLNEELKFTKAYCHLMKIRYGNSLDFEYNIDEKLYDYLIVPLSLQTLVENAIKHNVVSNKQPLKVKIEGAGESIKVSNPVQLKKEVESSERIGLANLAERYKLMWKKEIITVRTDNAFEVTVPLMKS